MTRPDPHSAAAAAARAIPPAWPLSATVAVNPFLGQSGEDLAHVAARLARVAGVRVTMPRRWYAERIDAGTITPADLAGALAAAPPAQRPADVAALMTAARAPTPPTAAAPTVADLAADASGLDWPGMIAERLGAWAAGYFDEGQALWAAPRGKSAYGAWRATATHDLTPEIMGLAGFATFVADAPETAGEALAEMSRRLALPAAALESYFHQLLMSLGGWSQVARQRAWQAELAGGTDATVTDLLTIRLIWDAALLARYAGRIGARWAEVAAGHAIPVAPNADQTIDAILQEAAERASQRSLGDILASPGPAAVSARPLLQAAFCIDVRSEVFRRALESLDPGIRTLGFAGFFGLGTSHRGFASDVDERRLPVLLNPGVWSCSVEPDNAAADQSARFKARATRAWGRFKAAAVSSFAFVEASGPLYAAKLLRGALGVVSKHGPAEPPPRFDPALDLATRVQTAASVLRAMSMTSGYARLVLLVGHGANVTNNPHASGLHCGACGGYSGEVNAQLLATLLNDPGVRAGLVDQGIEVPATTLFVAGLHDTTTDGVTLYPPEAGAPLHELALRQAVGWLAAAGDLARAERALRLPDCAGSAQVARRSRDWAEVRPEWGLAGCQAFIAAPRALTAGRSLAGRAFLHDYDWRADRDFNVLELILTAPVVVASWISLQYYGSTVAPAAFGGGDKLLHNGTGGMGVVEGNGGLLRAGLPWQSVHDGVRPVHEPLRLSVCIAAPRSAIDAILTRHDGVRALFDNRWLHLFVLDDAGRMAWRYTGDLTWQAVEAAPSLAAAA